MNMNSIMNLSMDVQRYLNNEMQMQQIKAENNILLQRVKQLETKINKVKQQKGTPCKRDEQSLNAMVAKSLHFLAKIHTFEVVGNRLIPQHLFNTMVHNRYNQLMDRFLKKLYYRRLQSKRNVQTLYHLDFKICQ